MAKNKNLVVKKNTIINFAKYWVDEQKGLVHCPLLTKDNAFILQTPEVHGLLLVTGLKDKQRSKKFWDIKSW